MCLTHCRCCSIVGSAGGINYVPKAQYYTSTSVPYCTTIIYSLVHASDMSQSRHLGTTDTAMLLSHTAPSLRQAGAWKANLFLGRGQHEVILRMGKADHHAFDTVLAASRQHTEEVNAEGACQLSSAAYEV